MANSENLDSWSITAIDNQNADTSINWLEGQVPGTVNNSARSMMAALRRYARDTGGALVAGGTATALTATTGRGLSASHITSNGFKVVIRTASAATGAATLALDGTPGIAIRKNDGTAIAAGNWASGAILVLYYSSTATALIAANLGDRGSLGLGSGDTPTFAGLTISASVPTVVVFDTDTSDTGVLRSAGGDIEVGSATNVDVQVIRNAVTVADFNLAELLLASNYPINFQGTGAATTRTNLGLGTAAVENTGTSGDAVPKMNQSATWSAGTTVQFIGNVTVGNDAGDTVIIKGVTVNSAVSAMWDAASAALFSREVFESAAVGGFTIAPTVDQLQVRDATTGTLGRFDVADVIQAGMEGVATTTTMSATKTLVYVMVLDSDGVAKWVRGDTFDTVMDL